MDKHHQIPSITPLQEQERHVATVTNEVKSDTTTGVVSDIKTKKHQKNVLDQTDLLRLNWEQRQIVEQMLFQMAAAFSGKDLDIENVTSTNNYIKLHDNTPGQLNYHYVPKPPLYAELKVHIEDLLNRG